MNINILLVLFIKNEIKIIPLANKISRFLVALEESTNPENGLGYMIPFKDSVYFAISIEFDTNKINSSLPIVI